MLYSILPVREFPDILTKISSSMNLINLETKLGSLIKRSAFEVTPRDVLEIDHLQHLAKT